MVSGFPIGGRKAGRVLEGVDCHSLDRVGDQAIKAHGRHSQLEAESHRINTNGGEEEAVEQEQRDAQQPCREHQLPERSRLGSIGHLPFAGHAVDSGRRTERRVAERRSAGRRHAISAQLVESPRGELIERLLPEDGADPLPARDAPGAVHAIRRSANFDFALDQRKQQSISEGQLEQLRASVRLQFAQARGNFLLSAAEWPVIRDRFLLDHEAWRHGRLKVR